MNKTFSRRVAVPTSAMWQAGTVAAIVAMVALATRMSDHGHINAHIGLPALFALQLIPTAIAPIFVPKLFSDKPEFQNGMRAAFYFTGFLLAAFIDLAMAGYLVVR